MNFFNSQSTRSLRRAIALAAIATIAVIIGIAYWPPVKDADAAQANAKTKAAKQPTKKTATAKTPAKKKVRRVKPPPEPPLDQNPYRVQIRVAFSASSLLNPEFRAAVMRRIKQNVANGYGKMWFAEFIVDTQLAPRSRLGLEHLTSENLLDRYPRSRNTGLPGLDKVFFIAIEAVGGRIDISTREWDVRSQQLSAIESQATYRREQVADVAWTGLTRVFRPIFILKSVDAYTVEYHLRAASFPPVDPNLEQVQPNDVIVPYFRYADRDFKIKRVQFLPWTYTIVQSVERHIIKARIISAFRAPLGSGRRRRVEMLAMRLQPRGKSSRLKMVYQTDETKSLVGYNVTLVRKFSPRDVSTVPQIKQFSGRDGYVDVPVDPQHPVTWVYVYSGRALLARVPYVAGLVPKETIPLPDDSIRLSVEGDIAILMGDLIDTIARRATLMALAIMDFNDPKLDGKDEEKRKRINAKIDEMIKLTKQQAFLDQLAVIRGPRMAAAKRLGNRFAERRIKKMCDKAEELIKVYLKPEIIDGFIEDIEQGKFDQRKKKGT